jgi:drug/metabolite transporter (DMT)-like permease
MKDWIFGVLFVLCSVLSAFVFTYIKVDKLPSYSYILVSLLPIWVGYYMLQYSELSLLKQSVLIMLTSRTGYLVGLTLAGEHISLAQWAGVIIMLFGSLLTNK